LNAIEQAEINENLNVTERIIERYLSLTAAKVWRLPKRFSPFWIFE
jgi:hypothetical protein